MRTLAQFYSRTLRTSQDQVVVQHGPYRFVRHPGYLGSVLIWAGFALTSGSPSVVALVAGLFGPADLRRISGEDKLLGRDLTGYAEYSERTKKLIPYVW